MPWHALAYLIHPSNLFNLFNQICIESLSPFYPPNRHPNSARSANTSCFKKADTRTLCSYALLRQPPSAHSARGPLRILPCNFTAKQKDILVDTP